MNNSNQMKAIGFSLIEILMLLGILTIVILPMLMVMDRQQGLLDLTAAQTTQQLIAKRLIDNVDPRMPLAVDLYDMPITVSSYFGSNYSSAIRYSVWCDPASKDIDRATVFGTSGVCLAGNADYIRPPFFTRSVDYITANDSSTIRVTVELYNTQTGGTSVYKAVRDFDIDTYRVNLGTDINDSGGLEAWNTLENKFYAPRVVSDSQGKLWYPESTTSTNAIYWSTINGSCSPSPAYTSADSSLGTASPTEPPFTSYRNIGCSGGDNVTVSFKVLPSEAYDIYVYGVNDSDAICNNVGSTLVGAGCNSAELSFYAVGPNVTLTNWRHLDASMETGQKEDMGYVKYTTLKMPAATTQLNIIIQRSTLNSITGTTARMAGIELVRRSDQGD